MTDKILTNEMISDEELDNVAGGTTKEIDADIEYITKHTGIKFGGEYKNAQLYDFFMDSRIRVFMQENGCNQYYYKGMPVPREFAVEHAVNMYFKNR
ncbi:MAG: hypothetical protein K6G55_04185 [Selenomonadaceae bacterium]|nr:hypothetical protein [Selenomonadaceae bacterium]